jgi:hypothetical protein
MTPEEKFAVRCSAVADELGLLFAGQLDAKVDASIAEMRRNLNREFVRLWPAVAPGDIAVGVDSIIAEIQKRRHEIEAAGETPRAMKN